MSFAGRTPYPRQFWLLVGGLLVSTTGLAMVGPFMMIYMSERLSLPLASVASALTVSAALELAALSFAGPVVDRVGRKPGMLLGLSLLSVAYFLLSRVQTLPAFMAVMALLGLAAPLYRVGADAMLADLLPPAQRLSALAWWRVADNLGFALGPSLGGFVAGASPVAAFYLAAAGPLTFCALVAAFARETLPAHPAALKLTDWRPTSYGPVLANRRYVAFVGALALFGICASLLWSLLGVYVKHNYGVPEQLYGFIPATNALLVVGLQVVITRWARRYPPLWVISGGVLIYAVAVASIAAGQGFWHFWLSFVLMTLGEMLIVPAAGTYAANSAPADLRGRYMGLYGLAQGLGRGVGPVAGGLLNDHLGPRAIWLGGGLVGLVAALGFARLAARHSVPVEAPA